MMEPCSHRFTAAEGGARLAAAAAAVNTLVTECGAFIATRLIHEEAYSIRGLLSAGRKRSVHLSQVSNVKADAYELGILTDLKVAQAVKFGDVLDWDQELEVNEVLVCTSEVFHQILEDGLLKMSQINIMVIDSCHTIYKDENLQYIMKVYKQSEEDRRPRILAITYPLFNTPKTDDSLEEDSNDADNEESSELEPSPSTALVPLNSSSEALDFVKPAIETTLKELGVQENLDDFQMYSKLEYKIDELEKELCCQMDLAEDIDGCKRMSGPTMKPKEVLIEYDTKTSVDELPKDYVELENYMKDTVGEVLEFLEDHRHDPTEIYGEELYEEFKNIPNPTIEPRQVIKEFLYILDELGPFAADKAAFSLLGKLEKLKIKVPYERHFLLLRLCTTVFVKIRCHTENVFSHYEDWDKIRLFSTPKLLRLIEILEKFTPPDLKARIENGTYVKYERKYDNDDREKNDDKINENDDKINENDDKSNENDDKSNENDDKSNENDEDDNSSKSNDVTTLESPRDKLLSVLDKCDFITLGNRIEDSLNVVQGNLKELDIGSEEKRVQSLLKSQTREKPLYSRSRPRGRRTTRTARPPHAASDALCALVFLQEPLLAKILYLCIVEITRVRPAVSYINSQYCAVEPIAEFKECQKQGKRHEEVLKKFRMHECNLLLTTSALEEGIDLPRCNLVLRWDTPPSYRSYVLCRSRARAIRSSSILLGARGQTDEMLHCLATYKELDQENQERNKILKILLGRQEKDQNVQVEHLSILEQHFEKITGITTAQQCTVEVEQLLADETVDMEEVVKRIQTCSPDLWLQRAGTFINLNSDKRNEEETLAAHAIITRKCGCGIQNEPPQDEESHADAFNTTIKPYTPPTNKACVCIKNRIKKDIARSMKRTISDSENIVFDSEYNILDLKHMQLSDEKSDDKGEKSDVRSEKSDDKSEKSEKCTCMSSESESAASVDLNSAISLINRYCAKLPSDTFTRLAPQWWIERVLIPEWARPAYVCTLRLPLNCPVKYNIVGHPMPTRVLARRMAALQACRILHKSGELDNQLMPIGKENFKAMELESAHPVQDTILTENDSARPGTTKRRQYYYKRTAWVFTNCQPVIDTSDSEIEKTEVKGAKITAMPELKEQPEKSELMSQQPHEDCTVKGTTEKDTSGRKNMLYAIESSLWCALPERYNTRGRRLHAPQHADQALAILMARDEPTNLQIPAFPVYTRSGEVRVSVEHVPDADVRLSPRRGRLVKRFMHFVFTEVLRVRRRGMALDNEGTRNNYYIVPTVKTTKEDGKQKIDIDWAFLEQIYNHTEQPNLATTLYPRRTSEGDGSAPLKNPLLKDGEVFVFEAERYKEAVVTPWYRNQDQPQFFLVAEICTHLTPESAFPSPTHDTFQSYYSSKYKVELTQPDQPLLDVDHTSARLNLLTPRYVNRKGVALPVSSERTRRAKRDRLDQKQILVPELCTVHPFAAPLWFATVALPCVLYRINALLIADEIRRAVAIDVGLGVPKIDETTMPGFVWPPLDFGWCLAEVLSADAEKSDKKKEDYYSSEKESVIDVKAIDSPEPDETSDGDTDAEEKEKTINDILQEEQERLNESADNDNESGFEIGTWSNEMASSIPDMDDIYDEWSEPLPPNLTFCTSANGGVNWCDPVQTQKPEYKAPRSQYTMADSDCSYTSSDFDSDDSDFDVDTESDAESGFGSNKGVSAALGVRIEYKTAHEAEAVDMDTRKETKPSPQRDPRHEKADRAELYQLLTAGDADPKYIEKFRNAVETHKQTLVNSGQLITKDEPLSELLPETKDNIDKSKMAATEEKIQEIFPYENHNLKIVDGQISIDSIERNKRVLLQKIKSSLSDEEIKNMSCFYMKDIDIDDPNYVNEKIANVGFDSKEKYVEKVLNYERKEFKPYYDECKGQSGEGFDFDYQPDLEGHPGPSPSVILQALTMSNANDGINLERLETIGDSFLKFAITAYLYCAHPTVHEGKLSHMRSKQVSNLNLYRLGRSARLGARMIASKFEPHDNWLPPCHKAPPSPKEQHDRLVQEMRNSNNDRRTEQETTGCYIPYNLITQHSIPDKSIADCVEALIGAYLLSCGPRGALLFMAWLGISVLPHHRIARNKKPPNCDTKPDNSEESEESWATGHFGPAGARRPYQDEHGNWYQIVYGELKAPPSPLLRYISDPEGELERMLSGYDELENTLQYRFKDRSLLLQALTHASHHKNTLTDCYQRLEFLGDAILDYLITRHLYEDPRRHSPGALTDLRSALVNNTIFATLAVRHGFHKYFRHTSPGLNEVLMKYVKIQEENGHSISEEHYLIQEDEQEQAEDVEVPKALGDLFESIAGAIFLDSGMSLGAVWGSYVRLMGAELEAFSAAAPKSPVRELLEAEPDTAKFSKPERLADGRRVRVCVEVFGRGTFKGIGRNYRIAKGTAARCALRHLRKHRR